MRATMSFKTMLAAGAAMTCLAAAPASAITYISYSSENLANNSAFAGVFATTDQSDGIYELRDVLAYTLLLQAGTTVTDYSDTPLDIFGFNETNGIFQAFANSFRSAGNAGFVIQASNSLTYIAGSRNTVYITFDNISISIDKSTPAVPEPATWAMILVGFGMVGGATRYRRRNAKISFA